MSDKFMSIELVPGLRMPTVGLGTFTTTAEEIDVAVTTAVEIAGYRHIDTAFLYFNEAAIGTALKRLIDAGKVKREELFITTKLPHIAMDAKAVEVYVRKSLENLQMDYVDLYLVHYPCGYVNHGDDNIFPVKDDGNADLDLTTDHVAIWKKMEEMMDEGLVKAIGLSNFNIRQIQRVLDNARIKPANLQVECHAYFQQTELYEYCRRNDISFTAYAPLGSSAFGTFVEKIGGQKVEVPSLLKDPLLAEIAENHKKSPAQVLLRWLIERGMLVVPKSVNPIRIKENIDVFDFELTPADTEVIKSLDRNLRIFRMDFLKGMTDHPEYPF